MHNDFTLFTRTYPNGTKTVFYYACGEDDMRLGPWTTKCLTLTAAGKFCNRLLKAGRLIPCKVKPITFREFAEGFWERGSDYIRSQEGRGDITDAYLENGRKALKNQILPFFGDIPLEKLTGRDINKWLLDFKNREKEKGGKKTVKGYKNTCANTVSGTLHTMLEFAVQKELTAANPCPKARKLKNDRKAIEIITVDEVHRLFPKNSGQIWDGKETAYIANRPASLTGMRAGEIPGLKGEFLYEQFIYVCGSYGDYGCGPAKTKDTRFIPLIPEMISLLKKLMIKNGKGYLFSADGGAAPVSRKYLYNSCHRALQRIGISREEIKRRGLPLHAWRHFVNTGLQLQGLTIRQAQSVIGHKPERMSEWYNHPDAGQIEAVMKAQNKIYGRAEADGGGGNGAGRPKIIKMREPPARRAAGRS